MPDTEYCWSAAAECLANDVQKIYKINAELILKSTDYLLAMQASPLGKFIPWKQTILKYTSMHIAGISIIVSSKVDFAALVATFEMSSFLQKILLLSMANAVRVQFVEN